LAKKTSKSFCTAPKRWAFGALAGVALLGLGPAKAAELVELEYEVYFGGMHIVSAKASLQKGSQNYRISSEATTQGMLKWMFGWTGNGKSVGAITPKGLQPVEHSHNSLSDDKTREVKIDYNPGGKVEFQVKDSDPDSDEYRRTPLDLATIDNTIDPMSAILSMSRNLESGHECVGEFPIFDGQRRYNITLTHREPKMIEATEYSVFSGEAVGCEVKIEQIGGFWKKPSKYSKGARNRVIWVARPIPESPPVPVKLNVQTKMGTLVAHLTRVRVGGRELALRIED